MSQQNLLSVGFNVPELQAQAKEVEAIVVALFEKLKQYDNIKLSPVDLTGLQQLTQSIQAQQQQLQSLTSAIQNTGQAFSSLNSTVANNSVNMTNAANAANAATNAINANTTATNANAGASNAGANATNRAAASQAQLGRNMLKNNDYLKQLYERQALLNRMLANSMAPTSGASAAQQRFISNQIKDVNKEINTIEKALERAGSGGARALGKSLSESLSVVRQLAYILPGIGMAGIFNLIFEAIGSVIQALANFNEETERTIAHNKDLADSAAVVQTAIEKLADAFEKGARDQVENAKRQKDLTIASGANYEQQITDIDNYNQSVKQLADQRVKDLHASQESVDNLNAETISNQRELLAAQTNLNYAQNNLYKIQQEKVSGLNMLDKKIHKEYWSNQFEKDIDIAKKHLEAIRAKAANDEKKLADQTAALKSQADANNVIDAKKLADAKYYSDEERKIRLSNAEYTAAKLKDSANDVLKDEQSIQTERIQALADDAQAEKNIALAKWNFVKQNEHATRSERVEAENTYNEKILSIDTEHLNKLAKLNLDYFMKHEEMRVKASQEEIRGQQITNKTLMDNEQATFDNRIAALDQYIDDRTKAIETQYAHDVRLAANLAPDLRADQMRFLNAKRATELKDVQNDIRKQAYDISESWFEKEQKQIKKASDVEIGIAQDSADKEMTDLNEAFNKKIIGWRKFIHEREQLEHNSLIAIDKAREQDDADEIKRIEGLQSKVRDKLSGAMMNLFFGNPKQKEVAKGEVQAFNKELEDLNQQHIAATNQQAKDHLRTQTDISEQDLKIKRETEENYIKAANTLAEGAQKIANQIYEEKIARLEAETEAYDKMIEEESNAITRSTLSQKEKNAYEIQLAAEKNARDEKAAQDEKKIKHDQAVFDKDAALAKIALNTAVGISSALALGAAGVPLAFSIGVLGATEFAVAAAVKIPSYWKGGTHLGGPLTYGEIGPEIVKEPHKKPYIVDTPTLGVLPSGTEIIPLYNIPSFPEKQDQGWAQTLYLGKAIAKSKKEIKNIFRPKINIDLGTQMYKQRILHGQG